LQLKKSLHKMTSQKRNLKKTTEKRKHGKENPIHDYHQPNINYKASTRISKGAITLILMLIIRSLSLPWPELFIAAIMLTRRRTCGSSGFWSLFSISSRLSSLLPLAVSKFFTPSSLAADFFCSSVGCFFFFESEFG